MALVELLWGGLRPIAGQVVLDILALIGFGAVAVSVGGSGSLNGNGSVDGSVNVSAMATLLLLALVFCSSGNLKFTNRWTIVFPMVPFIVLQTLRQMIHVSFADKASASSSAKQKQKQKPSKIRTISLAILGTASGGLLLLAAMLTVLFPAVELPLPDISHVYDVGIVDLFLPKIEWTNDASLLAVVPDTDHAFRPNLYPNDHFAIRVLYPTATTKEDGAFSKAGGYGWSAVGSGYTKLSSSSSSSWIPYLRPHVSDAFHEVNMKQGAPPPLKTFGWFTHYWNLIQLPAKYHAPLLMTKDDTSMVPSLMPMVIYSPGLGGSSETYSYQTLSLAARGFVVVVLEHGDGSLAVLPRKDGTVFRRSDDSVEQDWESGNHERYKRSRRAMTEYRSQEILATTRYLVGLNQTNLPELESKGVSFVGRLDPNDVHFMGHSFGGASVLHAAFQSAKAVAEAIDHGDSTSSEQRPILPLVPKSIVAHDPVSDWMPDHTRWSLFDLERLKDSNTNHTYFTKGQPSPSPSLSPSPSPLLPSISSVSIHDFDLFLLFSHQWGMLNWGGIKPLQDMEHRRVFGRTRTSKTHGIGDNGGSTISSSSSDIAREQTLSLSKVEVLDSAHHIEFSDICMITPTWLARAVNMTGVQNPIETAKDIHTKTLNFFMQVRGQENFGR